MPYTGSDALAAHLHSILDSAGEHKAREVAGNVRVRTGALRDSITWSRDEGSDAGVVSSDLDYAAVENYGSRPHAIPNAFGYGEDFGTEPDFHPGTEGSHAWERALVTPVEVDEA